MRLPRPTAFGCFIFIVLVLPAALLLLLVIVNLKDRPPSAEARAFTSFYAQRPAVADSANGFVFMFGMAVPPEQDPMVQGRKRLDWLKQATLAPAFDPSGDPLAEVDFLKKRDAQSKALSKRCNLVNADCLQLLSENEADLRTWLHTESWLLDRYRRLLTLKEWQDFVPLDEKAPIAPMQYAIEGQKLLLVQALLQARRGDVAGARALLEEDAGFWLNTMAEADALITRMIAVRALERHMLWTNVIALELPPAAAPRVAAGAWTAPLSARHCSLWRVMASEWMFYDRFLKQMDRTRWNTGESATSTRSSTDNWLVKTLFLTFQPQDASNRAARQLHGIAQAYDGSCAEHAAGMERARKADREAQEPMPWYRLYNLSYRMIVNAGGVSAYADYGARVADVEAMRRAMLLLIDLRRQGVTPDAMAAALQQSEVRTPHDHAAYRWDAKARVLTFDGLAASQQDWYAFIY
jgi:hypothetical protein